jgi:outer membrane protein assembly factor BamB
MRIRITVRRFGGVFAAAFVFASHARAADQPQWGVPHTRNMISTEMNLPSMFDPETGENIRWTAPLGTETHSTPIVTQGKVLIGTNNGQPRDSRHSRYRGVLLCLDEKTGDLVWQLVVPRFEHDRFLDWRTGGICSVVSVEGEHVYLVCNRAQVICLDLNGQQDGNDGPVTDEGRRMAPAGTPTMKVTDIDADILWTYDMVEQSGIHPHDSPYASVLVVGDYLYVNTSNGVDKYHRTIPSPDAPSLIVLDRRTGQLVAQDDEKIGPRVFHCTWSSPALGVVDGKQRIFFCGGDGVCYGFDPYQSGEDGNGAATLDRVWRFDCDPTAPKENVHRFMRNRQESPSTIMGMPVFHDGRIYVSGGGDIWWGKRQAWIKCIDATKSGDTTKAGPIWSSPLEYHSCCTPAVYQGMVFATDHGGNIHCLDAETGKSHWVNEGRGAIFSSAMVADGKVYVGTKGRTVWVLAASRKKKLLASIDVGSPIVATPVAANETLYIATMKELFAVAKSGE